ncbi:MAG: sigma 54-interacting transcriptional regulator [Proteobacteria bacterium]|nr:sigma 54-interacting transcriptional regulator [Pseudomonadota bacterium]
MKYKILVVDDEKVLRYTFEEFLKEEGYEVVCAEDYKEALEKLENADFDLIFTDIVMGGETGIDLLRDIRKKGINSPVVIITGRPDIDTATEAVRLGAFDYISKPVDQHKLLKVAGVALKYKEAVDKKEEYRSNLEAIFASVKEGIVSVDSDMKVIEINSSALRLCGLSRESVGKQLNELSGECNNMCMEALKETLDKKKPIEGRYIKCDKSDNPDQVVSISTSPLVDGNRVFSGAIMLLSDESRVTDLEKKLKERRGFQKIIGNSEKMQDIYSLIESLANVQSTVLITGESGTGKELVAEAIHYSGVRSSKPLVKVNCSALSENLLESELFGHVKGSFTGATYNKIGRFQLADGGTIFLDEISGISPNIQLKLLRVLQDLVFERVGDSTPVRVDVRVIAATNRELSEMVKRGEFRDDLYYRLKVLGLHIPPLRDRVDDIPLLLDYFLDKFNAKFDKRIRGFSEAVHDSFLSYPWPGNIRELEHAVEHAFILCRKGFIDIKHLPGEFDPSRLKENFDASLGSTLEGEAALILKMLDETRWNRTEAAKILGMDRSTLYRKIVKYGLK